MVDGHPRNSQNSLGSYPVTEAPSSFGDFVERFCRADRRISWNVKVWKVWIAQDDFLFPHWWVHHFWGDLMDICGISMETPVNQRKLSPKRGFVPGDDNVWFHVCFLGRGNNLESRCIFFCGGGTHPYVAVWTKIEHRWECPSHYNIAKLGHDPRPYKLSSTYCGIIVWRLSGQIWFIQNLNTFTRWSKNQGSRLGFHGACDRTILTSNLSGFPMMTYPTSQVLN